MRHDTSIVVQNEKEANKSSAATSNPVEQSNTRRFSLTDASWEMLSTEQFKSQLLELSLNKNNPYKDALQSATKGYEKPFCDYPDSTLSLLQDYLTLLTAEHRVVPEGKLGTVISPNGLGREFYGVLFNQNRNLLAVCPGGKGSAAILLFEKMPNGVIGLINLSVGRYSVDADHILPFLFSSFYCATIVLHHRPQNPKEIEFINHLKGIKKLVSSAIDGTLAPESSLLEQVKDHIHVHELEFKTTQYPTLVKPNLFDYLNSNRIYSHNILDRLISNGADLEEISSEGQTPLQVAIYYLLNKQLVDLLIKKGAKPISIEEIVHAIEKRMSLEHIALLLHGNRHSTEAVNIALTTAIKLKQKEIALFLIKEYRWKLTSPEQIILLAAKTAKNDDNFSILNELITYASNVPWHDASTLEAMDNLLKNNNPQSYHLLNHAKLKVLYEQAIKEHDNDAAIQYISPITDMEILNNLLWCALWNNNSVSDECFQVLLQKGVQPDLSTINLFFDKPQPIVPFSLQKEDTTSYKISINEQQLDRYIKAGLDINQFDERKGYVRNTFLMKAVLANDYDAVQLLLSKNASVNLQMADGTTPLMIAVQHSDKYDNRMIINALLIAGADLNLQRNDGIKATQLLPTSNDPETQRRLNEISLLLQNHHSKAKKPDVIKSAQSADQEQKNNHNIALNMKRLEDKINNLALRLQQAKAVHHTREIESLNEAYQTATTLHTRLTEATESYLIHHNFDAYKNETKELINTAHKTLDKHRGWSEFLVNLSLALLGGVGLMVKGIVNLASNRSFFFVHQTASSKILDHLEEEINRLEEEVTIRSR
ncbi:ankyrin repeat domain-containing protein [Legionella sp. km535]|uniref:ankyrin repeat domain-containing protein n=1 Tax=Legionella sp. km535 TaxID=2498107 RepID=UPI000F8C5AEB|nr:ankyrin repeat domain-containing protein [Legionella sp. km535]RUR17216.1 ankyrin repeat domain-containing protein [Legionella sp. km535]